MKIQKSVKALKTEDYSNNEVVIEKGSILDISEKETEYGPRIILRIKHDGKEKNVFLNQTSKDDLIDGFGDETEEWVGEQVKVTCKKGEGKYKQLMLLVQPTKN